jgi:hypothetical protein
VHPTLFPTCLYCSYCLLPSSSFFPWVEVGLSRGLCCSGPGLSVGVPRTMKLTWSTSFQAIWALVTGGPGALLVSPFNMKWRSSALAGGVEGSKSCLFSVIMPAKCPFAPPKPKQFLFRSTSFSLHCHLSSVSNDLQPAKQ